ncbi:MAG: hypothetical protein ACE5GM_07475 [bacterium]
MDYKYKGSLGFDQWYFVRSGHSPQHDANDTLEFKGEAAMEWGDGWEMLAAPRIKADLVEERRNRQTADEAWIQYAAEDWEFRAGMQTFFWGTVESVNIVDILNQRDYEDDFLDPDKWGEFSGRFSYFLEDYTLELYYLPWFRAGNFPSRYARYSFTNGRGSVSTDERYHDGSAWNPQGAARLSATYGSSDVAVSLFHGWSRFPVLALKPGDADLVPHYYKEDRISGDIQTALGDWLLKGEFVYKNTDINDDLKLVTREPDGDVVRKNMIPGSYGIYVFGGEYEFERVVDSHDLTLLAEYLGDTNLGQTTPDYRIFQNDLFLGLRYSFNDVNDKKLEAGGFLALERGDELIYTVKYSQRFLEDFNLIVEYRDIMVEDSDSPTAVFKEDGRLSSQILWNF